MCWNKIFINLINVYSIFLEHFFLLLSLYILVFKRDIQNQILIIIVNPGQYLKEIQD